MDNVSKLGKVLRIRSPNGAPKPGPCRTARNPLKILEMAPSVLTSSMDLLADQVRALFAQGMTSPEQLAESLSLELHVVKGILGINEAPKTEKEKDDYEIGLSVLRAVAQNNRQPGQVRVMAATTLMDEAKGRRGAASAATAIVGAAALNEALKELRPKRDRAFAHLNKKNEISI